MNMYTQISRTCLAVVATVSLFSCSNDNDISTPDGENIEVSALPQASRSTLDTHFNDATVTSAKKSSTANIYGSIYTAILSNSFEIDFNADGLWTEIESEKDLAIPTAFLDDQVPQIQAYLAANYADRYVIEIERERFGYTVELNNGVDLVFDTEQQFVGIDLDDDDDDDEVRIALEELPELARTFLTTHFQSATAITVKKDTDDNRVTYDVYLSNGVKVEFDATGAWVEIESKRDLAIPASLIPSAIAQYIVQTYPAFLITDIEINDNGSYSVEIKNASTRNDFELEFDANGNFLRLDD